MRAKFIKTERYALETIIGINGWKYKAYGSIIQVNPVIIDYGIIELKDEINTHDERCIGQFIPLKISHLGIINRNNVQPDNTPNRESLRSFSQ